MAAPRKKRSDNTPASPASTGGIPEVYVERLISLIPALEELAAWWQERKTALAQASDTTQETERVTFHVERRWIEAIRRRADLDHLTITQVVNQAFRQYLEEK